MLTDNGLTERVSNLSLEMCSFHPVGNHLLTWRNIMKLFAYTLLAAATFLTAPAVIKNSPFHASAALARQGADDPAGHERKGRGKDDGAGHASKQSIDDNLMMARRGADDAPGHERRGRGADDAPGHERRGRGADDGAGHASIKVLNDTMQMARRGRGKDDPVGHG
jgi:hypothetical protein